MATTVKEIFEIAIAIADNQKDGSAIATENEEYQTRTPYILNALQSELASRGKLYTIMKVPYTVQNEWITVDVPDDLEVITRILLQDTKGNYQKGVMFLIEEESIKLKADEIGTIMIEYKPIPDMLTSINDIVNVSDSIARSVLPYGLVAHLFSEEQPTTANFCQQKYDENKEAINTRLAPSTYEHFGDSYGGFNGEY